MEQLGINGSNQVFPPLSAGFATRDVSGNQDLTLASNEGASDLIELTGALTGNIVVTVPYSIFPQVVGTSGLTALTLRPSWLKIFKNSTTGGFTVTVKGPAGSGVVLPTATAQTLYSKDGDSVQLVGGGGGGGGATINGAQIVYQPGGVAFGNVYTDWPSLFAAFNMALALNDFVTVGFDGMVNAGNCPVPAGIYDFKGRAAFFAANTGMFTQITIAAGGQLRNVASIDVLSIQNSPGAGIPCMFWEIAYCPIVRLTQGPIFDNVPGSGAPFASFDVGLSIYALEGAGFFNSGAGAGVMFAIPSGGLMGLAIALASIINSIIIGAVGFTSGDATTTLEYLVDSTFGPNLLPQGPSWLGTTTFQQFSKDSKTVEFLANGTFTVPYGVTECDLEGCGGAGGGGGGIGGGAGNAVAGGGGGAALLQKRTITGLTQGTPLAVTIGAGGAGGLAGPSGGPGGNGSPGGVTSLAALALFDGGSGGEGATNGPVGGAGGMPYVANGNVNLYDVTALSGYVGVTNPSTLFQGAGGHGGGSTASKDGGRQGGLFPAGTAGADGVGAPFGHGGGGGGAGPYGAGGNGGAGANNGANAVVPVASLANSGAGGGGGGSGGGAGTTGANGASGASGRLKITWRLSP